MRALKNHEFSFAGIYLLFIDLHPLYTFRGLLLLTSIFSSNWDINEVSLVFVYLFPATEDVDADEGSQL